MFTTTRAPGEISVVPKLPRIARGVIWARDPDSGRFLARDLRTGLRLYVGEHERRVCLLLDGTRSVAAVAADAIRASGKDRAEAAVGRLIEQLAEAGALEDAASSSTLPTARNRRWAFVVFRHTEPVFAWCARAMSWAYSWRVVGTIGLAAAILYLWARPAWHALTWRNILRLSPAEMVLLIVADVVVVVLHECAHACSVQHFGGRARSIALGAVDPSAFATTDVTDIYAMHVRSSACAVLLAGPWTHLVAGSIALGVGRLLSGSPLQPWFALLALVLTIRGVASLLPWIESDAYYLVAYLSDIPNLRKVSGQWIQTLLRGPAWERDAVTAALTPMRKRVLIGFAIAQYLWGTLVIAALAVVFWRAMPAMGRALAHLATALHFGH